MVIITAMDMGMAGLVVITVAGIAHMAMELIDTGARGIGDEAGRGEEEMTLEELAAKVAELEKRLAILEGLAGRDKG
jgi:hypothetical protein